jgi:hypothetical protein
MEYNDLFYGTFLIRCDFKFLEYKIYFKAFVIANKFNQF